MKAVVLLALALVLVLEVVAVEVVVGWRAGGVIDTLAAVLDIDGLINVVNTVAIALGFAVPGPCSVDVMSDVAVDLLTDVLTDIIRLALANNIVVEILVDVNINVFGGVMTAFEFIMPGPLEAFCC